MPDLPIAERPLRADARRNRERILAAAQVEFARAGVEAQMDDVARTAGVGVGTVYRHYPTKEALLAELAREMFRRLIAQTRDAVQRTGDPFQVLSDLLLRNAEMLAADAAMQQTLMGADPEIWVQAREEQEELTRLTDELLVRGRAAGTVRADVAGSDVAMLMSGLCSTMGRKSGQFDWHRHLELIIDALRPRD